MNGDDFTIYQETMCPPECTKIDCFSCWRFSEMRCDDSEPEDPFFEDDSKQVDA